MRPSTLARPRCIGGWAPRGPAPSRRIPRMPSVPAALPSTFLFSSPLCPPHRVPCPTAIHPPSGKVNSRNFTSAEFCEVPHWFLGTSGVRNSRKPGFWYRRGILRSEAGAPAHDREEDYMAEETRFWGVVLPRWPAHLLPQDTGFIRWPEFLPNGKPVHHYP